MDIIKELMQAAGATERPKVVIWSVPKACGMFEQWRDHSIDTLQDALTFMIEMSAEPSEAWVKALYVKDAREKLARKIAGE